jgi:glutamyl endopeptidase
MRKTFTSVGVVCSLLASLLFSFTSVNSGYAQEELTLPIGKTKPPDLQRKLESAKRNSNYEVVQQKDFSPSQLQDMKKLDPFTSVGNDGSIVTPQEQKEQIQKHHFPNLDGSPEATKSAISTNGIVGSDDRTQITDTSVYPYHAVAYIDIMDQSGAYVGHCTGFFIDDNTVATAGHCVYDTYYNKWYGDIYITPAQNGTNYPYGVWLATAKYTTSGFMQSNPSSPNTIPPEDIQYDYAVLKLPSGFANIIGIGWFAIRNYDHTVGEQVNATGYPGDKPYGTMWRGLGYIRALQTYRIDYDADVMPGESGGPVFNQKNGTLAAIGLNSAGTSTMNYSPRFTGTVYDNLMYWSGL